MSASDRRLLLLRHAKAVAASPGMSQASDHARPLSERGRADAIAMGNLLRHRALMPDRALVSTALRTRETFALLGALPGTLPGPLPVSPGAGGPELVLSDALYLADRWTLLEALRDHAADAKSVVLIGHNPGLHELASMLAASSPMLEAGFATCMLALFAVDGDWPALAPGRAALLDLLRP